MWGFCLCGAFVDLPMYYCYNVIKYYPDSLQASIDSEVVLILEEIPFQVSINTVK